MKKTSQNNRHNDPKPVSGDNLFEVVCNLQGGGTKSSGPMSVEEASRWYHAAHISNRMAIESNGGVPLYTNIMLQRVNQF